MVRQPQHPNLAIDRDTLQAPVARARARHCER